MTIYEAFPSFINWAKVTQKQKETTPDPYFHRDLPAVTNPSITSTGPPCQYTANCIRNKPTQQSKHVADDHDVKWINCHLLSAGAQKGCPRVYKLESVNWFTLSQISVPDIAVTALFWSHVDALSTFLNLTRPLVYFLFYNWVGESRLWAENSHFCIKREGVEVTVCGLSCVLSVTDKVLQVGFLKRDTVDNWVVGCVYTMCSGAKNAWAQKGSVNRDVPMEQSIETVKTFLGLVPAYMCFILEP